MPLSFILIRCAILILDVTIILILILILHRLKTVHRMTTDSLNGNNSFICRLSQKRKAWDNVSQKGSSTCPSLQAF
jgi:hypothetical protein